jgi:putative transposase
MYEVPKDCNQQPFADLGKALSKWYKKEGGLPSFKKKGQKDSFYLSNDKTKLSKSKRSIWVPKLGLVRLKEKFPFSDKQGRLVSVTISREADRWFASLSFMLKEEFLPKLERAQDGFTGFDAGKIKVLTSSQGVQIEAPKPLFKSLKKLARAQRKKSRQLEAKKKFKKENPEAFSEMEAKQKARLDTSGLPFSGKNLKKQSLKVQKIHREVVNQRKDFNHKLSTKICKENQFICLESLDLRGMIQKGKTSNRNWADVSIGQLYGFIDYKAVRYGSNILKMDPFYPSSKNCSRCGSKKPDLKLEDRVYACDCGLKMDRDFNASLNILKMGLLEAVGHCGYYPGTAEFVWKESILKVLEKDKNTDGLSVYDWGDLMAGLGTSKFYIHSDDHL